VQEWGGIAYALSALAASLPEGWEVVPIIKVGRDLAENAFRFLRQLPRLDCEAGVRVVPEPNNRVELRYLDEARRTERLSGGVPPWQWPELVPLLWGCDALYVNFISGFEMELDTAGALRDAYAGPAIQPGKLTQTADGILRQVTPHLDDGHHFPALRERSRQRRERVRDAAPLLHPHLAAVPLVDAVPYERAQCPHATDALPPLRGAR
jgi:hypothetical protein